MEEISPCHRNQKTCESADPGAGKQHSVSAAAHPGAVASMPTGLHGHWGFPWSPRGCRGAVTHPLEGLSTTTDTQALRSVKFTTLALHGKFLALVSVTSLGHLPLVFTTESLGSFRLPARGCSPSKGCSGAGEFQQSL